MSSRIKPSRILVRFESEIASASSPVRADCKRAERAAYLARLGRGAAARKELDAIRSRYAARPQAEIVVWLNLLEGLLGHFGDINNSHHADPGVREKIRRAHALGSATGLAPLRALAAGWLAHLAFLQAEFESMAGYAVEVLETAAVDHHAARSRVCLVLAKAHHFSGRVEAALPWYERCRHHAVDDGDDATLSAQMHDMAWLRAQDIRAADCGLTGEPTEHTAHAVLGAESTVNFDRLIGSVNLRSTVRLQRAQIMTVQRRFADAAGLFDVEAVKAVGAHGPRFEADLLADRAWCRAHLKMRDAALADARKVMSIDDPAAPPGARAMVHARLAQTFEVLDLSDDMQRHRALSNGAWAEHRSVQAGLVALLADLPGTAPGGVLNR